MSKKRLLNADFVLANAERNASPMQITMFWVLISNAKIIIIEDKKSPAAVYAKRKPIISNPVIFFLKIRARKVREMPSARPIKRP